MASFAHQKGTEAEGERRRGGRRLGCLGERPELEREGEEEAPKEGDIWAMSARARTAACSRSSSITERMGESLLFGDKREPLVALAVPRGGRTRDSKKALCWKGAAEVETGDS